MQLALEIKNGPDAGRSLAIDVGQEVTIGRRTQADIVFTQDPYMSGIHMRIKWKGTTCILEDLNSTAGTYVNGERATQVELEPGMKLRAGKTEFVVRLGKDKAPANLDPFASIGFTSQSNKLKSQAGVDLKKPTDAVDTEPVEFDIEECGSGLVKFRGAGSWPGPGDLAKRISSLSKPTVVIDPHQSKKKLLPKIEKPAYLYSWMKEFEQSQCSPLVLTPSDGIDLGELLEKAWDENAALVVFSKAKGSDLMQCLRGAARGDDGKGDAPPRTGLLGYFWPKAARPFFASTTSKPLQALFSRIDAVMVEAEEPGQWEVYCKPDFAGPLQELLEAGE